MMSLAPLDGSCFSIGFKVWIHDCKLIHLPSVHLSSFLRCRSQCQEYFLFLCHQAKSPPGRLSPPHSAARVVPAPVLWPTSKPKLSSPEHSEQRLPRCPLLLRGRCRGRVRVEAVLSRQHPPRAPAQHPHRRQPGYQSTPAALRQGRHLLASWTPLVN